MSNKVSVDGLSNEIMQTLRDYGNAVDEAAYEAVKRVADETAEQLKASGDYGGRKYRKSFAVKEEGTHGRPLFVVFSKMHRFTHLLEFGHAKRNGKGRVRAFPHWKPAEESAIKSVEKSIIDGIGGIKA